MPMPPRPFTSSRARLAGLLLLISASCFTGDGLVGQPCQSDEDCNPAVDALGEALRCANSVCGYVQRCGDGIVDEAVEQCDAGEAGVKGDYADGPGQCSASTCRLLPYCGDGEVTAPREECDDADADDQDACPSTCLAASCGDGFVGPGEACDPAVDTDCTDACARPTCGDGVLQGDEACDDGDADDADACLNTCVKASCGDAIVWAGIEQCDDANEQDGDACLGTCKLASCGDGLVQAGVEQCDDANLDYLDACVDGCTAASCGDMFVHKGVEQCDDGNTEDNDDCTATCQHAKCGDGIRGPMEECDDGNLADGDGCSASCGFESCGDGLVQGQETCDDGNDINTDACVYCHHAACGDGVTWAGVEQCDDGNMKPTGACPTDCKTATCGDGFVWAGKEQCDDGNDDNTDACTKQCTAAKCGDGYIQPGEACDDGNMSDSDACLKDCTAATCGDAVVWQGVEGCDDGNADNNDGCANACTQGATGIGTGDRHTCAVRAGKVRCWGKNESGQLGYGSTASVGDEPADLPLDEVAVGGDVLVITGGTQHTCALLMDKSVRCWGRGDMLGRGKNKYDDIGDGPNEMPPVDPADLGGLAVHVESGEYHTCALLEDDTLRCWGFSQYGQCGYPGVNALDSPKALGPVPVGAPVKRVAAGNRFTCAILKAPADGQLRCWGENSSGQLGLGHTQNIGDNEDPKDAPFVQIGEPVVQIDAGGQHACAVTMSGAVYCWGDGGFGALGYQNSQSIGDNESPASAGPVKMLAGNDSVAQIRLGERHTCVRLDGGDVRCWGSGDDGRLGHGNTQHLGALPGPIAPLVAVDALPGTVLDIILGEYHTCAIVDGGAVRCWGGNPDGQLARGNTNSVGDEPGEMPPKDALLYDNP